jgi:membrane-associated phospholipid phosphatase
MTSTAVRREAAVRSLPVAVLAAVSLAVLAQVALHTAAGQRIDDRALRTVVAGRDTELAVLSLLGHVSATAVLTVAIVTVGIALLRGRARLGVAALVVLLGSNITTQVLKHGILDRTAFDVVAPNSLPSGHTTGVAGAVCALIIVAPRSWRQPVALLGAFAVTTTGTSTVVAGWHRPADVLAALAVALLWSAGAGMVLGSTHDVTELPSTGLSALVGAAGGLLLLVGIGVRPSYGWVGFVDAAGVLGVLALATALMVTLADHVSAQP